MLFSQGGRSAAKIGTECLLHNRVKSYETNIHYYYLGNLLSSPPAAPYGDRDIR